MCITSKEPPSVLKLILQRENFYYEEDTTKKNQSKVEIT